MPGVKLFSLQKWHGVEQLRELSERLPITELPDAETFADTAAVMTLLDLIITADTSVAHLAGALGVPVWVALAKIADWRWLFDREDTPWYPTMRLFRQETLGDWKILFNRMAAELDKHVNRSGNDETSTTFKSRILQANGEQAEILSAGELR